VNKQDNKPGSHTRTGDHMTDMKLEHETKPKLDVTTSQNWRVDIM